MATFIRDAKEKKFPRREISDSPSHVGALVPVQPNLLAQSALTIAAAVSAIKYLQTGDSGSAVALAVQSGLAALSSTELGDRLGLSGLTAGGVLEGATAAQVIMVPLFFQFFPETIVDSRSANVSEVNIPFFSNPMPTFSSASPRIISFSADFAQEKWAVQSSQQLDAGLGNDIAFWDKHNFNVGLALQALRSLTYPVAVNGLMYPLPLYLSLPGTRIGIDRVAGSGALINSSILCFMKSYSSTRKSFFPDGVPRIGSIQMDFQEFANLDERMTFTDFSKAYVSYAAHAQNAIYGRTAWEGVTKKTNSAYDDPQILKPMKG